MKDRILELKEEIKCIQHKKKDYFLNNSKYIFEYFENKKNISSGTISQTNVNKSNIVNNFFVYNFFISKRNYKIIFFKDLIRFLPY